MGTKFNRGFSINKDISHRLDKVMQDIVSLRQIIIEDEEDNTELQFANISQLVEWIFKKTLPQLERKIQEIKDKK